MARKAWKHPQRAKRWVIVDALDALAEAAVASAPGSGGPSPFLRVYRHVRSLAYPDLRDHKEPAAYASHAEAKAARGDVGPVRARRYRWNAVGWWVDAWWRSAIFAADPTDLEMEPEEYLTDDGEQRTNWNAVNGYRALATNALDLLLEQSRKGDVEAASVGYDRAYRYLRAVTCPVVQRLPRVREQIAERWSSYEVGEPEDRTRARRMDTVPMLVDALHRSAILGQPVVPHDPAAKDLVEDAIPEAKR